MTQPRKPKGTPTGGQFASTRHAEPQDISEQSPRSARWGVGVVGKQLLGFPGSKIVDVQPTASYLIDGPDTIRENDFKVTVRLADGEERSLPKPYRWYRAQIEDPDATCTTDQSWYRPGS